MAGLHYTDCDWRRCHPCSYLCNDKREPEQGYVVADAFRSVLDSTWLLSVHVVYSELLIACALTVRVRLRNQDYE